MSEMAPIEFDAVIICEDVRQESNGKEILIGVYSGGVVAQNFPAHIALTVYLQFISRDKGKVQLDIRIMLNDQSILIDAQAELEILDGTSGAFWLPPIPLVIPHAGELRVQARQQGKDFETIKRVVISAQRDASSTPSPSLRPSTRRKGK